VKANLKFQIPARVKCSESLLPFAGDPARLAAERNRSLPARAAMRKEADAERKQPRKKHDRK
jgi:hypothetical protein